MSLTAFFLCAGYGSRLRPLTDRIAKPAIPFLGETAFEINVEAVAPLEPERWIANAHHLPQQIQALGTAMGVTVLVEPEILGTGGCLANAADILRETDHFLVHNADLIHGIDLRAAYETHLASNALATLVGLHRAGAANTLAVGDDGALLGVHGFRGFEGDPGESKRLTFSGIAFYRRDFLAFVDSGESDIKPCWSAAMKGGARIRVVDSTGAAWHDFGTPQGLWEAARHRMEVTRTFAWRYPAAAQNGEQAAEAGRPCVSNEAASLPEAALPADLRNVLVFEDPRGHQPSPLVPGARDVIVGRDFSWPLRTVERPE
jgi:mannose-1-phosphate guanylyltransferase